MKNYGDEKRQNRLLGLLMGITFNENVKHHTLLGLTS
jgi:hypothetical protein